MRFPRSAVAAAVAAAWLGAPAYGQTVDTQFTGAIVDNNSVVAEASTPVDGNPISGSAYTGGLFFSQSTFYGDLTTGTSAVRVLAGKNRDVLTELVYEAVVTNDTDTDMALDFRFFIGRGRVGIDHMTSGDSFSGSAALDATITWGDTQLWRVYLGMTGSGAPGEFGGIESYTPTVDLSASAQDFNVHDSGSSLYYDPYAGQLGLGILGAHQSKVLSYRVAGSGYYTSDTEMDMYGYGGQAVVGNTDPFDFEGRPVDELGNPLPGGVQPVPEPETYAMVSVGLVALALAARRRRRPPSSGNA
ncbi:MAG: PEP-CTERM sorting domain-containing protein [Betaproteobacteria bacterium]|nr:PEP-CTERM sorting domain-containing protein [Betaproteobacteria bacterium]